MIQARTVKLTPYENSLSGQYRKGEYVIVECDSTSKAFSVTMKDATSTRNVLFKLKKTDSSSNAITINFENNQTADGETSLTLTNQWDTIGLISDGTNYVKVIQIGDEYINHGSLSGLNGDDHPKYLLADGTRKLTGNWDAGDFIITSGGLVINIAGLDDFSFTANKFSVLEGSHILMGNNTWQGVDASGGRIEFVKNV